MGFGHRIYKNYDPRAKIVKHIAYEVFESKPPKRLRISYSDNFASTRRGAWTH